MLGKIIKHELKLSLRENGLICVLLLIAGVICPLLIKSNVGIITFFAATLYIGLIVAAFVMTLLILYRVFYKSMFENEGYITNVIPVRTSTLVIGKFLSVIILIALVFLSIVISLTSMILISIDINDIKYFLNLFGSIFSYIAEDGNNVSLIIISCIYSLSTLLTSAAIFFFAATIFNTFKTRRFKFFIIFIFYIIIYQIISYIATQTNKIELDSSLNPVVAINIHMIMSISVYTIFMVLVIWGTIFILNKKVDIQ